MVQVVETLAPIVFMILVVGIIGLVVWLFVRSIRRGRGMRDDTISAELQQIAEQRGWAYQRENIGMSDRFAGRPFKQGSHDRRARDLITGTHRGRPFCCFQHSHTTRHTGSDVGTDVQTYFYWVFAIRTAARTPMLEVSKHDLNSKFEGLFGMRDHELGNETFDSEFKVLTDDERFAGTVLTEPTMQWLLADQRAQRLPFRFERDEVVTWIRQRDRFDPAMVEPTLDYLCDILDRTPRKS